MKLPTTATNWRNIVVFLLLLIALTFSGEAVVYLGTAAGIDLSTVRNFISGFARVAGVMLSVWVLVIGVSFSHTVGPFLREKWVDSFSQDFNRKEQFLICLGIITLATIACALCFSLGF